MKEKIRVIIIYDIKDDKRRRAYVKILSSYGYRIQYSAFEAYLSHKKYEKLKFVLKKLEVDEDSVIMYKMNSLCETIHYGDTSYLASVEESDCLFL